MPLVFTVSVFFGFLMPFLWHFLLKFLEVCTLDLDMLTKEVWFSFNENCHFLAEKQNMKNKLFYTNIIVNR